MWTDPLHGSPPNTYMLLFLKGNLLPAMSMKLILPLWFFICIYKIIFIPCLYKSTVFLFLVVFRAKMPKRLLAAMWQRPSGSSLNTGAVLRPSRTTPTSVFWCDAPVSRMTPTIFVFPKTNQKNLCFLAKLFAEIKLMEALVDLQKCEMRSQESQELQCKFTHEQQSTSNRVSLREAKRLNPNALLV